MKKVLSYLFIVFTLLFVNVSLVNAEEDPACEGQTNECIKCTYTYDAVCSQEAENKEFYFVVVNDGGGEATIIDSLIPYPTKNSICLTGVRSKLKAEDFFTSSKTRLVCPNIELWDENQYDSFSGTHSIVIQKASHGTNENDIAEPNNGNNGSGNTVHEQNTVKPKDTKVDNCSAIMPPDVSKMLNNLLKFIQYLGPVLVAVLTIMDLVKASVSGEQDALKKVYSKFLKRIIAAALLFFVPLLVDIIFVAVGLTPPKFCL